MLFLYLGKDQDVIQIDHHNVFCYEIPEDIVHHGLKGGQAVVRGMLGEAPSYTAV